MSWRVEAAIGVVSETGARIEMVRSGVQILHSRAVGSLAARVVTNLLPARTSGSDSCWL